MNEKPTNKQSRVSYIHLGNVTQMTSVTPYMKNSAEMYAKDKKTKTKPIVRNVIMW